MILRGRADIEGEYRYSLTRYLEAVPSGVLVFIMLNPSTADAEQDDPTIRRCIGYARRWEFNTLRVVNLYALRSTDPRVLRDHPNPVGPRNEDAILAAIRGADRVVAAWGVGGGGRTLQKTILDVTEQMDLLALGLTKGGHPRHPLYCRADLEPIVYRSWRGCP